MSERLGLHASLLLSSCLTLDYCNLSAPEFSSSPWWQQHVCQQIWKTQQGPQYWKRSLFIAIPKKGNAKECLNYYTIALISHASKVMPQIMQARHQQYVNRELPDIQDGFIKGRGTRDQIANIRWIIKTKRIPEKHLLLLYWLCQSLWLCGSQ